MDDEFFEIGTQVQNPKPKRNKKAAFQGPDQGKAPSLPRITIRITGFRVQPLDPDNFSGSCKDLIDGLRHAGLIFGDEWDKIIYIPDQRKVAHKIDERTEVEIIYPDPSEEPTTQKVNELPEVPL